MRARGGPPGPRWRGSAFLLLLAACGRLYGALLVLYPKAFRRRYEAEMRRDFRELMLEGLQEGGTAAQAEDIMEKELLLALDRRGKLTAVEAALESPLSVEEAERMLQNLAVKGHLEVTVEHGRLHYALWDRDAPL
jgi:hypothetical protein